MDGIHRFGMPVSNQRRRSINFFTPASCYDPVAGEGVGCGSRLATAIRGEPFLARNFADGNSSLIEKLSLSWGCDWDPAARKVYVAVPNLGLLVKLDYDSSQVDKRWFIGPGTRSVAYDPVRRRVYLTDFLRTGGRFRRARRARRRPLVRRPLLAVGAAHPRWARCSRPATSASSHPRWLSC
jgi:hypothetical protein